MRIAIRGFAGDVMKFEDRIDRPIDELEALLPELAEKHGKALAESELHMIEIEFLDEPDRDQAFFRFGTDPRGMVQPIALNMDGGRRRGK